MLLGLAVGFFLATKQYLALAGPAALVLLPRPFRPRPALLVLGTAAAVAVALTATLAVWDLPAFVRSTWTVQQVAPFREDALSYAVRVYQATRRWWPRPVTSNTPQRRVAIARRTTRNRPRRSSAAPGDVTGSVTTRTSSGRRE